ncbi:substrate-binding domain-containing protein [Pelomonas aquatica]|jgi:DNA-binding LacI/PurR family transcriptional regulator|nr:substrate-binding domain-containing protein [Pelomonas aquatica]MCY4756284.1 substrate-binding domain-containing protein [Pelomonas aquatica]
MTTESKPVTMEQIAALAGVSTITVSRALRDSPSVTPATRERVKTLAEAAGYRFNHHARNLRLRRSHMVAVMLEMQPDTDRPMTDAYPLQLLGGITQELTSRGYSVLLSALQSPGQGVASSADGVILLGQGANGSAVKSVAAMGLPLVVWGAEHGRGDSVVVGGDNAHGGASAAERLVALGRRELLFLGDVRHAEIRDRQQGFAKALKKAGIEGIRAQTLTPAAFTFGAGFTAVQAHLARGGRAPDGLFAASDLLAMGAVRAFTDAGLAVPEAVSVIGYDDSPAAQSFAPPLTSVRQDWHHGGVLLARKVLDLIAGQAAASEIMPTELVVRAT